MKQCIKCGKIMHDEEIFCSRCGLRWSPEYKNADDEETLPLGAAPMGTGLGDDEETLPLNASQMRQELGDDEETLPLNAYQMRSGTGDDEETLPLFAQTSTMSTAPYSPALDDEETLPLGSANLNEGIGDDEETLPLFAQNDAMSTAPYSPALDDEETLPLGSANLNEGIGDDEETLPLFAQNGAMSTALYSPTLDDEETLPLGGANLNEGIGDDEETLPLGVEKSINMHYSTSQKCVPAYFESEDYYKRKCKSLLIFILILICTIMLIIGNFSESNDTITSTITSLESENKELKAENKELKNAFTFLCLEPGGYWEKGYSVKGNLIFVLNDGKTKKFEVPTGLGKEKYTFEETYRRFCNKISYTQNLDKIVLSVTPGVTPGEDGLDVLTVTNTKTNESCDFLIIIPF